MENLNNYIKHIKDEVSNKNVTDELHIIMLVYLDLGKRLSFDLNFKPFGNSRYKQNLYRYHSLRREDIDKCLETNIGICKSMARLLQLVLLDFNINIEVITDDIVVKEYGLEKVNYPHVYNKITLRDGRTFVVDLQEDIRNIRRNNFTKSFGTKDIKGYEYVISREEQRLIHKKLGYISESIGYTNEYLYLIHYYVDGIDNIFEKADFILQNIDPYPTNGVGYTDRQWQHKDVLEEFFTGSEFDYFDEYSIIKFINAYKVVDNERKYFSFVQIYLEDRSEVYLYNENNFKYDKVNLEEVANMHLDGLIFHKSFIHGLDGVISRMREERRHK